MTGRVERRAGLLDTVAGMHQFSRDPEIPDGSVWQNKRFHQQYKVVGFSPITDRYMIVQVFPEWIEQYMPKNKDGTVKAHPISPEWLKDKQTMKRVNGRMDVKSE